MAFNTPTIALLVAFFGVLSFILGIVAENKKPEAGIPIGKDVIICKFPKDPTVALGSLSFVALLFCTAAGYMSVFYPYKGVSVPKGALFKSTSLLVFFIIAIVLTIFGGAMTLWVTITEGLHHTRNVHHTADYACPTAKTGLFGGAAFLCLDSALFWLLCQMLALNSREDYLTEDTKGDYGQVLATDYEEKAPRV